jgi:hypothetical protein
MRTRLVVASTPVGRARRVSLTHASYDIGIALFEPANGLPDRPSKLRAV